MRPAPVDVPQTNRHKRQSSLAGSWPLLVGVCLLLIFTAATVSVIFARSVHQSPTITIDPFDANILASTPFPLYYPDYLPDGYRIDPTSVDVPQPGVVVLTMVGPRNHIIYMSQEARVSTFDYGGYYTDFSSLQETVTTSGVIAVGYIDNGRTGQARTPL